MASDTFTGADGTALATHDANWDHVAGNGIDKFKIYSNALRIDAFWQEAARYSASSSDTSEIVVAADTGCNSVGVLVRAGDSNEGYRVYLTVPSGGNWTKLYLAKDGNFLASFGNVSYPINTTHTLKAVASGTSPAIITAYVDGSQVGSPYSDSTSPIASGSPGIFAVAPGTSQLALDDWTDLAGGAPPAVPMGAISYYLRMMGSQ